MDISHNPILRTQSLDFRRFLFRKIQMIVLINGLGHLMLGSQEGRVAITGCVCNNEVIGDQSGWSIWSTAGNAGWHTRDYPPGSKPMAWQASQATILSECMYTLFRTCMQVQCCLLSAKVNASVWQCCLLSAHLQGGHSPARCPKRGRAKAAAGAFSILDPSMQSQRCNQSWHFATGMKSWNSCLLKQVEVTAPVRAASDSQVNPLRAGLLSIATKLCLARPGPLVPSFTTGTTGKHCDDSPRYRDS